MAIQPSLLGQQGAAGVDLPKRYGIVQSVTMNEELVIQNEWKSM